MTKKQHIYPLNKHSFGSQLCLNNCMVQNNVGVLRTHIKRKQGACSYTNTLLHKGSGRLFFSIRSSLKASLDCSDRRDMPGSPTDIYRRHANEL